MSADKSGPLQQKLHFLGERPAVLVDVPFQRFLVVAPLRFQNELESGFSHRISYSSSVLKALFEVGDFFHQPIDDENVVELEKTHQKLRNCILDLNEEFRS